MMMNKLWVLCECVSVCYYTSPSLNEWLCVYISYQSFLGNFDHKWETKMITIKNYNYSIINPVKIKDNNEQTAVTAVEKKFLKINVFWKLNFK